MSDKRNSQFSTFHFQFGAALAGLLAGIVNGIFGGAGGMILIPTLQMLTDIQEDALFPMSVSVMLPVSLLSLWLTSRTTSLPWAEALPYLLGSVAGGVLHNMGQIGMACLLMGTDVLKYYAPFLVLSGTLAGVVIGLLAAIMVKRIDVKY